MGKPPRGIACVLATCVMACSASNIRSPDMNAVGGVQVYRSQRLIHLKRLRENLHVSDPVVRAREIADIDAQIQELETGGNDIELGPEVKIERVVGNGSD